MGIKRTIEIDGQQVAFKASAAIPRIYRLKFHRDIYKDLAALEKSVGDNSEGSSGLDMFSLEMFENIAYIMAKYNGPRNPDQGWKKDREHGRIGESTERGNKPWHEQRTARSSRQS